MDFDQIQERHHTYSIKWDGACQTAGTNDVLPMSIADMDFQAPQPVIAAIVQQAQHGIYGYASEPNMTQAPQVIAQWLQKRNQWEIDPANLGYCAGVVNGLGLAIQALTKEQDAIITQTPLYGHFKIAVEAAQRRLISNPLKNQSGHFTMDWQLFEQQIVDNQVKMAILCNPHNPSGRVWTSAELQQYAKICEQHQVIILSDDIHSDLILPGNHYQPLAKAYPACTQHLITFKSPSKTFNVAGLQFAYYYTENEHYRQLMADQAEYQSNPDLPNSFGVPAVIAAYQQSEAWLDQLLVYLGANFKWLTEQIESQTAARVTPSQATYLAWIDVSYLKVSEAQLQTALVNHGLVAQTNSDFGLTTTTDGLFVRLNYAMPRSQLAVGIQRFIATLQALAPQTV